VKAEHQSPFGLLQQHEFPVWKWEGIAMDFVTKLPRTSSGHDTIWVIIDQSTKFAHFLPMYLDYIGSSGIMGGPSTPSEPMSESSSTGKDTDVYVTVECSESDMIIFENKISLYKYANIRLL
ncbi:putative reverse transcriptase domain-containing protein, partial [Tanacetum coccineum]